MNNHSPNTTNYHKWRALLKSTGNIMLRIIGAGLALVFGFWLLMASNMGPAYLPNIMNGALDFWIRMILLGAGLGIWISFAVWLIWLILCYFYDLIRRHQ